MELGSPEREHLKRFIGAIAKKLEKERNELLDAISARDRELAALTDETARKEEWWKMRLDKEKERYNALKEQFDRLGVLKEKEVKAAENERAAVSQQLAVQKVEYDGRITDMAAEAEEAKNKVADSMRELARKFEEEKANLLNECRLAREKEIEEIKEKTYKTEEECKKLKIDFLVKEFQLKEFEGQLKGKNSYIGWLMEKANKK